MVEILMFMNAIFGLLITLLSISEKDYKKCIELHGEEFATKRKKLLRITGPCLLAFSSIALVLTY